MLGGFSFHVSEACLIALICEVLIFFLRIMQVRLDRLELIKEPSQFKTYSLRGNTKAKGSLFFVYAFFFFLLISTLIALFQEIVRWKRRKMGTEGRDALRWYCPAIILCMWWKNLSETKQHKSIMAKWKQHISPLLHLFEPLF